MATEEKPALRFVFRILGFGLQSAGSVVGILCGQELESRLGDIRLQLPPLMLDSSQTLICYFCSELEIQYISRRMQDWGG